MMNEFTQDKASGIPAPVGICRECAENLQFETVTGRVALCYCAHNATGGVFFLSKAQWQLITPTSAEKFYSTMKGTVSAMIDAHTGKAN